MAIDSSLIVGSRVNCISCNIERLDLIDKDGITHSGYKVWQWAQVCGECKTKHSLEFYPIYKGQNLEETVNGILHENWKEERSKENGQKQQQPPELPKIESDEEWLSKLQEKYQDVIKVANANLPGLWQSLEFELSVQKILNIKDCTLPFAGIVLGPPSSLKTVGIDLFRHWLNVYYTDSFSAKSFVSHSTAVSRRDLPAIDMLPKIKNKLFLTPELSPTFSKKDDDLIDVLGILTRVLDGHGYESDTGAHGHRGYNEPMMFTWIGAAVDIPYKVHKLLGTLGPKLYFFRLSSNKRSVEHYLNELDTKFEEKKAKVQVALFDYLNWFERGPGLIIDEKTKLQKIEWDFGKNDESAKTFIVKLGILLARLRGVVPTWHTDDTDGLGYGYTLATIEEPDRAITQLMNLARGHALSQGRNYIEDVSIVAKVVFSTASLERVRIFELLLEHAGKLTTTEITDSLKIVGNTAKRIMAEFRAIGLVTVGDIKITKGQATVTEKQISLHEDFHWTLEKDFSDVRNLPPYYSDNKKEVVGDHFSDIVHPTYLKCSKCSFNNIHQSEMDHHFRLTHKKDGSIVEPSRGAADSTNPPAGGD